MLRTSLIAAAAALSLGACASSETGTDAADARDCFFASQVSGYSLIDDHHIAITAGTRRYILTTNWNAQDLNWTQAIALRSSTPTICTGRGLGVTIYGGDPPQSYPVAGIALAEDNTPTGS